jgi:hypothetical protein
MLMSSFCSCTLLASYASSPSWTSPTGLPRVLGPGAVRVCALRVAAARVEPDIEWRGPGSVPLVPPHAAMPKPGSVTASNAAILRTVSREDAGSGVMPFEDRDLTRRDWRRRPSETLADGTEHFQDWDPRLPKAIADSVDHCQEAPVYAGSGRIEPATSQKHRTGWTSRLARPTVELRGPVRLRPGSARERRNKSRLCPLSLTARSARVFDSPDLGPRVRRAVDVGICLEVRLT